MYNKHDLGKLKERIFVTRALQVSLAALALFVLGYILIPTIKGEAHASELVHPPLTGLPLRSR